MQILTINNRNLKNRLGTHQIGPKWKFWKTIFFIAHQKNLVPRMLSHRENVRTSKFWQKSKENFENWPRAYKVLIYAKKNSKLSHVGVPLSDVPLRNTLKNMTLRFLPQKFQDLPICTSTDLSLYAEYVALKLWLVFCFWLYSPTIFTPGAI